MSDPTSDPTSGQMGDRGEAEGGASRASASEWPEVRVVQSTGSTLDDVRGWALEGARQGVSVAAHAQTAGRGRRGHAWASPSGGIYFSALMRPQVSSPYFVGLPAVCALGCLRAVREVTGLGSELGIKWPNDLVLSGRKLAGLLVEAGSGEQGIFAVLGVGINLERPADQPEGAPLATRPDAPASVRPLDPIWLSDRLSPGEMPAFDALARSLRDHVMDLCGEWEAAVRAGRAKAGPLAPILSEYFDSVPMLGRQVVALSPEGMEICRGVLSAIDAWGRVTVHMASGQDVELAAEQASLRQLD